MSAEFPQSKEKQLNEIFKTITELIQKFKITKLNDVEVMRHNQIKDNIFFPYISIIKEIGTKANEQQFLVATESSRKKLKFEDYQMLSKEIEVKFPELVTETKQPKNILTPKQNLYSGLINDGRSGREKVEKKQLGQIPVSGESNLVAYGIHYDEILNVVFIRFTNYSPRGRKEFHSVGEITLTENGIQDLFGNDFLAKLMKEGVRDIYDSFIFDPGIMKKIEKEKPVIYEMIKKWIDEIKSKIEEDGYKKQEEKEIAKTDQAILSDFRTTLSELMGKYHPEKLNDQ